jgi:hypothetical protein
MESCISESLISESAKRESRRAFSRCERVGRCSLRTMLRVPSESTPVESAGASAAFGDKKRCCAPMLTERQSAAMSTRKVVDLCCLNELIPYYIFTKT